MADNGRPATSHERMAGRPWDDSYRDGPAPWDIGGPQPAVVRLAAAGGFVGRVLDVGCGTGENALHLASLGLSVLGIEVAETALEMARKSAEARGLAVEFVAADALEPQRLGRTFDTVLDSGVFHTFDADERTRYVAGLAAVTESGATLHLLCMSDQGAETGPHPVSEAELRAAFRKWRIVSVEPSRIETRFHEHGISAWLARIERV